MCTIVSMKDEPLKSGKRMSGNEDPSTNKIHDFSRTYVSTYLHCFGFSSLSLSFCLRTAVEICNVTNPQAAVIQMAGDTLILPAEGRQ